MITTPTRRLWLYPAPDGALEILILGDDDAVAVMYARIRQLAENWRGFDRVSALGQGSAVLGVRVTISPVARHVDPIAEFMRALKEQARDVLEALAWSADAHPAACGIVATW